ncbi:MAG: SUF system NifU family Fe-S cluster assembly protein [Candidatus Phytoplasma asteris]|uniref:Protein nifU n=1 Tax='Chrysanthemum coronarium' phytoplasma TaxID=1520703 RepID=A0ABQ0J364_9MOLU|nr:SUF system NifU family Fe-S cluster assembly protein ['Chrysanthemum coronarium' phytoplasma]TKA87928.1 MAG: SUF system NifU family Fe-S cluster assembly protein [Periwinkle leaf yellowing phytoplasma]WEX19724.1 MAG: SUF system NifU family Fe-S cluster assembly protein [Candidatus Phytoplasma asteris]GAK74025.1 protein nifU ['Chrysanthemum coronarium' phytoplasma]
MLEINKLYRDLIIKHYQEPQNWGLSQDPDFINITNKNVSCGDSISLQIKISNQKLIDIKYETQACAICRASASLMSIHLKNLEIPQTLEKINHFLAMNNNQIYDETQLDKELLLFKHFINFPGRVACISLPWKALQQVIKAHNKKSY